MPKPPTPRRAAGDEAEEVAARHLADLGWSILGRNVRIGRTELDIVAVEPGVAAAFVVVEVRSRSGPGFGAPQESVDAAKVARLYEAAWRSARAGRLPDGRRLPPGAPRGDLVCVVRDRGSGGGWQLTCHLRDLAPP
jgi:Holliday junction resolvase-like predicted endonuclease